MAIASAIAISGGAIAGAAPEPGSAQDKSTVATPTSSPPSTPESTGTTTAADTNQRTAAPIRNGDQISTAVAPPPSAFEEVEARPVREPEKQTSTGRSGGSVVRSQQHALSVPADRLPELPAGVTARSERESVPAGFSKEDADLSERMSLVAASNCQYYWPSPHAVCGEIRNKYNAMGGPASWLNYPTTPEYQNPGNTGARSEFINGSIYWSATSGAHPVTLLFMSKWKDHGWEAGWMGYPTSDEIPNGDNVGSRQEFRGAAIYWHSIPTLPGLAVIGGAIRDKWNTVGAQTPGSTLGYPISDEIPLPVGNGRMNRFERGTIYWSPTTGAHVVRGTVLDKWASQGYETGIVGFPVADQTDNGVHATQQFQHGTITAAGGNAVRLAFLNPGSEAEAMIAAAQERATEIGQSILAVLQQALGESETEMQDISDSCCDTTPGTAQYMPEARGLGDIFYSYADTAAVNHGHNGIFVSKTQNIEAAGLGKKTVLVDNAAGRQVSSPTLSWVNTSQEIRQRAVDWAYTKLGTSYNLHFAWNRKVEDEQYNCSQLVWAAFMHASYNDLDLDDDGGHGVYPRDIRDSPWITHYYESVGG
ncbi:YiiX/YebB-like N1pC/P60 family cysteine hydrolase (plasmid) [Prescottella equi]|uniref:YiiX/YebB-like N1pC/P60 family cysteine hydrolase n=1 Tax=Rhodococcus hoagii TaxID=43767 RepID=UPI0025778A1F|nr:YiiX/YebB-like N1pC/P60 family cysteine hydrolase [Prescottella equi]WJJ14464.1 YiiX/YebB-like N1pC/P60 family cysteine hydrolase [Prescottella equi]